MSEREENKESNEVHTKNMYQFVAKLSLAYIFLPQHPQSNTLLSLTLSLYVLLAGEKNFIHKINIYKYLV